MMETAQPFWLSAATYEEHIAPMLDVLGRELEGAVHRISAALCYEKAGDPSRAVNLYRAAFSGPLHEDTRRNIKCKGHRHLCACCQQIRHESNLLHAPAAPGTHPIC